MILAGDIGGTNTRLAIMDDRFKLIGKPVKFPTGDGSQLESNINKVLRAAKGKAPKKACLAIAGPVIDGVCDSTNIGRRFVAEEIRKSLKLDSLTLINDLVANAAGIEALKKTDLVTLIKGESHKGNCAVLSPGTGLGEGGLIWDGKYHRPIPSEGGHSRFSPTNDLECELLAYLSDRFGTVSFENVCSGLGIANAFDFFVEMGAEVPDALKKKLESVDQRKRGGLISEAAMKKQSEAATLTMNFFTRALGIEAANLALKFFAVGGVYLGGGIPPKILPMLKTKTFKDSFLTHRTLGHLLKRIPVRVILNDDTALEGAAIYGSRFGN